MYRQSEKIVKQQYLLHMLQLGIQRVQACTRQHFAFALCCQNVTVAARSPGRRSNVENAPVDGQSPASSVRTPRRAFSLGTMSSYRGMDASL